MTNTHPKLHNASWPGLVGKVAGTDHPPIDLDTMLAHTARASVDGVKFDGIDLHLTAPHVSIDATRDELGALADKIAAHGLVVGSLVAPIWASDGGGSAMGGESERRKFLEQVRKACRIARDLRALGIRTYGIVRIDSACTPTAWAADPVGNTQRIAATFRDAALIARDHGERLAAEGEICWGGMHNLPAMLDLLQQVDQPGTVGFQSDLAHTLHYARELDPGAAPEAAIARVARALRPWLLDLHIAQSDGTLFGSGAHDQTGRHCLPTDPHGRFDITRVAGLWLRDEAGQPVPGLSHICWDGCMFPNAVMAQAQTWNDILAAMIKVRDAHGWVQ